MEDYLLYTTIFLYVMGGWVSSFFIYNRDGEKDFETNLISLTWFISIPLLIFSGRVGMSDDDDSKNSGV